MDTAFFPTTLDRFKFFVDYHYDGANGIIIIALKDVKKQITSMMIPSLLWLIFAAYLNGFIWFMN